jgi:hypothetical protein
MPDQTTAPRAQPAFVATQLAFAGHIRNPDREPRPDDVEDRRMGIYRDLFFNNVSGLLKGNFPVLYKVLGSERWQALMRSFLVEHRCTTPLFPEIGQELLAYIGETRGQRADDPPFLLELAHYEWVESALLFSDVETDPNLADPNGDLLAGVPVISPLAWNLSYRFPVHRIGPDHQPAEPPAELTHLVVYRNRQERVEFLQINAVTQRMLQLLQDDPDKTGLDVLSAIAAELQHPKPDQVVTAGQQLLEDLRARHVILGTRRTPDAAQDGDS